MGRAYVSNKYKTLSIGEDIRFEGGLFVAKNAEQERMIESNDFYGIHIHDRDPRQEAGVRQEAGEVEVTAARAMVAAAESEPRVRQGRRGTKSGMEL